MSVIMHIIPRADWEQAQTAGCYSAESLHKDGFIHFSQPHQVLSTANAFYHGQTSLLLLLVDTDLLEAELKFEAPAHLHPEENLRTDLFPHLYGPLNLDAVTQVVEFPPNADGTFTMPTQARKIELQPFTSADFARLISWVESREAMLQWAGKFFVYPLDEAQLERYWHTAQGENATRWIFKAVDAWTQEVVGHIELNNLDFANRSATISRVMIGKPYRGQGLAELMVRALVGMAFDVLNLHRLDLNVFDFNTAAIRCYEKVGFVREGHFRDFRRVDENTYWSMYFMSMLENEWQAKTRG